MITVTNTMTDPSARPDPMADVTVTLGGLTGGVFRPTPGIWAGGQITKPARTVADANGVWTVTLVGNDRVTNPSNTLYQVVQSGVAPILIQGHDDGATHQLGDLVVTNPAQFPALQPTVIGPAPTLTGGTGVSLAPGAAPVTHVTSTGPGEYQVVVDAAQGVPGAAATVAVDPTSGGVPYGTATTVTNTGTASAAVIKVLVQEGQAGAAATVAVDPTSGTVPYGTPSSVTNTGTAAAAILKFLIEQAQPGSQILTGTGTPTGTPPDGSLMLDTGNGNVWRYSGGAWSGAPVLNIMGPAGNPTAYELRGSGSPYGVVVPASAGIYYTDTAATNGAIRWVSTGTTNTSWIVEHGDTGWRDITSLIADPPATGTWSPGTLLARRNGPWVTALFSGSWIGGNGETVTAAGYNLWVPAEGFQMSLPSIPGGIRRGFPAMSMLFSSQGGNPMATSYYFGHRWDNGDSRFQKLFIQFGGATLAVSARVSWPTDDPWPTMLPGVPA